MVAGHTRFAPDRFFGLLKKAYRHTPVSSLLEIESMVSSSSIAGKNNSQWTFLEGDLLYGMTGVIL